MVAGMGWQTLACALAIRVIHCLDAHCLTANGPAIWGGCVTRRIPAARQYPGIGVHSFWGRERRVWHVFLQSRYKFYYVLARSRYEFDRSHEFIPCYKVSCRLWCSVAVQIVSEQEICQGIWDFNCLQMRESGCWNHYKFVLSAEAKAKTVTNNLPILNVLAFVQILKLSGCIVFVMVIEICHCSKSWLKCNICLVRVFILVL